MEFLNLNEVEEHFAVIYTLWPHPKVKPQMHLCGLKRSEFNENEA
jgi:hypothetical protein